MVTYIEKGNIFKLDGVRAYAHGCNCAGAMGRGIALQFKARYPEMYEEYVRRCLSGAFFPGTVYLYEKEGVAVFNLATEKHWQLGAQLSLVEQSLKEMMELAHAHGIGRIALPRIAAGLGKLDWEEVKAVLEQVAGADTKVELLVVENYEP